MKHVKKMSELLESSPLGAILNSCVPNDDDDEEEEEEVHKKLCCFYLNDYILSAYKPSMLEEQEVILLYILSILLTVLDSRNYAVLLKCVHIHIYVCIS